jgi:hypothetical protein
MAWKYIIWGRLVAAWSRIADYVTIFYKKIMICVYVCIYGPWSI